MTSKRLTREQLDRLAREVEKHRGYYLRLWRRAQANDMPLHDPLVRGICDAWNGVNQLSKSIEQLQRDAPRPYRPLAAPTRTSGLQSIDQPWAEKQRRMAEQARKAQHPQPPAP